MMNTIRTGQLPKTNIHRAKAPKPRSVAPSEYPAENRHTGKVWRRIIGRMEDKRLAEMLATVDGDV